ncbi:MAG: thioredoxin family protein [Candidatus Heimdallarchaeota archaeon]|jgi:glutaredoxin|nr:thioredoxin family protein [Candidatus Heimdallarchaeota archaeon]MCK4254109.1 thioredoxin family protein [Candidatus Heimdallarchaeota archaeon]
MYEMKEIVLYTSEECPYCSVAENILKTVLEEYGGLFQYRSIKVNGESKQKISSIPTIFVGKTKIEGLPEREQIHTALFS